MRLLRSEDGAALVTALMLTMLSLVISLLLLYSVTTGTRISASQKRYRSALAAAHGGVDLLGDILPRLFSDTPQAVTADFAFINLQLPGDVSCLKQKLSTPTASWSASCAAQSATDPDRSPDISFTLGGEPAKSDFAISLKIVDTVPGNTDSAGIELDQGSSVAGTDEGIRPEHVPAMYNVSVQGTGGGGREKARLSLLYAY